MPGVTPEWLTWILNNGAGGVLLAVLVGLIWAIKSGMLRTKFELTAWQERAERAEHQVDTVLPTLDRLTALIQQVRP